MFNISIDIGYGDTKVFDGKNCFKFSSSVEKQMENSADFESSDNRGYLFNGRNYLVGEGARHGALSTRGFNFLVKYAPLLIYHSLREAKADTSKPLSITTGLSIVNWSEKDSFLEAISEININNKILTPNIKLLAQGQGVFNDFKGDKDGLICIVDIGYNTLDFLVFENKKPRADLSFATKQGANKIITELQTKLQKRYGVDFSEQSVKDIFLKGYILNFGEKIDLSDEISDAKDEYKEFIIDELKSRRIDLLQRANGVVFSGGGAYFLENSKLPNNATFSTSPYEYANVRGYFND